MRKHKQGFTRAERIKKKALFNRIFREGRYFKGIDFSLRILPADINIIRLGISIQKSVFPKAIERNKVKRLIREAFRRNKHSLTKGYDLVIKPKSFELINSTYSKVEKGLLELFKAAKLLKEQ